MPALFISAYDSLQSPTRRHEPRARSTTKKRAKSFLFFFSLKTMVARQAKRPTLSLMAGRSQWSAWWVWAMERGSGGRACSGRSFRYARPFGANRGIAARERPRVSARSDGAHRDARALPAAPIPPTTRPDDYLDVPSLLERTASARSRLLVHVDKPTVLSEARRWVLRAVRRHNKRGK